MFSFRIVGTLVALLIADNSFGQQRCTQARTRDPSPPYSTTPWKTIPLGYVTPSGMSPEQATCAFLGLQPAPSPHVRFCVIDGTKAWNLEDRTGPDCGPVIDPVPPSSPPPPCQRYGNPIYPVRGVKREPVPLGLRLGRLDVQLTYDTTTKVPIPYPGNPADVADPAVLGPLWFSNLHRRVLIQANRDGALVARGNGYTVGFKGNGSGTYTAAPDSADRLVSVIDGYRYFNADDTSTESYDTQGMLTKVSWISGERVNFTYSTAASANAPGAGYLIQAEDGRGRSLALRYNSAGRLTRITDVTGESVQLAFDTQDNLQAVTWSDGTVRTHMYESSTLPWALTGVKDERGLRLSTFGYDERGRAVSTERAGGTNRFEATYAAPPQVSVSETYDRSRDLIVRTHTWSPPLGTRLTVAEGSTIQLTTTTIHGKTYVTRQSQPAGSGCAASNSEIGYDANGNAAVRDDFNGKRVCHRYDLDRNIEITRVEGLTPSTVCGNVTWTGAPLPAGSRKTSTQWHPDWRLETRIAEPGRLTTKVYNGQPDPLNGNAIASCAPSSAVLPDGKPIVVLCKQVEQATTDATGASGFSAALQSGVASRQTTWTYNQFGQVLTENGPRTDVWDQTTYAYFTDTSFTGTGAAAVGHYIGDLATVTNPAGKTTSYTHYNKHGQVLRSVDANGVVTQNTYDLRQRLLTTTVGGQLTQYAYDPVGQLKRVTLPDLTWVGYDYDDAHRLVSVYDHKGNRTTYTLDNAGNRIKEETKDPSNALRRQLDRSIDALGRVQQSTGL